MLEKEILTDLEVAGCFVEPAFKRLRRPKMDSGQRCGVVHWGVFCQRRFLSAPSLVGGGDGIFQKHRDRQRSDAAGDGRDRAGFL